MQTTQIKEWFEGISEEYQADIAFFTTTMLEDGFDMKAESKESIEYLKTWLTPNDEFAYRTLGKAVCFVAVFELMFADRFTAEGWKRPRELFERVIEEKPNEDMVQTAKAQIAQLPERQAAWEKIGRSWQETKASISFEVPIKQ